MSQDNIEKLLGALASRKTILDDTESIIKPKLTTEISQIRKHVNSLVPGAGVTRYYWLIGEPGNGKSQALSTLANDFKSITGDKKTTQSSVDIILDNASRLADIEKKIFFNSFALSSGQDKRARNLISNLTKSVNKSRNTTEQFWEFGLEIAQLFEISLPPFVGMLTRFTFNKTTDKWKTSPQNIRRSLLKTNPTWDENEEQLSFMVNWISYCLKPTTERWKNLDELAKHYSEKEGLFTFLCQILQKSKFSTFIILIDEVSNLATGQLHRLLRLLRDKSGDMNIVVICTALPNIESEITGDEQLRRRFWLKDDVFYLPAPTVHSNDNDQDDFAFAKNKIIDLSGKINMSPKNPSKEDEISLRSKLATQNETSLTWSILWEEINKLYNPMVN